MSRIRGRDTSPERLLRSALRRAGVSTRANPRTVYGRPDLGVAGRIVIFIDGCFWHGCPEHYVRPRSREAFWAAKLEANVLRDLRQTRQLRNAGYRVMRVWEHQVEEAPEDTALRVAATIRSGRDSSQVAWRVLRAIPVDSSGTREARLLVHLLVRRPPRIVLVDRHTRKWKRRK